MGIQPAGRKRSLKRMFKEWLNLKKYIFLNWWESYSIGPTRTFIRPCHLTPWYPPPACTSQDHKNPACGRQRISRPMRIVAPIPKHPASKAKFAKINTFFLRGNFTRTLYEQNFQIWDHFFPFLFPKDSEYQKSLDIGLREVGAKKHLNVTSKSEQTHRHMKILTHRKNPSPWLLSQPDPSLICTLPSLLGKIRPIWLP